MKQLVSLLISLSLILSLIVIFNSEIVRAEGETIVIWLVSDPHVGDDGGSSVYKTEFWDAVNDTNAMSGENEVDYAWCCGDMISGDSHAADWADFAEVWADLSVTTYKNVTIGNHDSDWESDSNSPFYGLTQGPDGGGLWSSYDIGNIRICIGGDEKAFFDDEQGYGECHMYGGAQRNWYNVTLQNASNYSMNTWIIFHQPLNDTVDRSDEHPSYFCMTETNNSDDEAPLFNAMMRYLDTNNMEPSLYISGHTHVSCTENASDQLMLVQKYGTYHLNDGSITGGGGTPDEHDPCSRYLYLTNGSKTVTIKSYNHSNDSFVQSKEYTIEMTYNFVLEEGGGDAPWEFTSINGQGNNTNLQEDNRTFVYPIISNTDYYGIRVGNSTSGSNVTDVFLQLDNISEGCALESMPGGDYFENSTHVTFVLPYAYNVSYLAYHYYQVRAYTRGED